MTPIRVKAPSWAPPAVLPLLAGPSRFVFDGAERRVMRKRPPIRPSVWAERHRTLSLSAVPGPWKNERTPYLTDIMDAAAFPSVETVILCKAPQVGGTEAAHNFVGYTLDRAPGPVMYVYPDKDTAADNSKDRIQPLIMDSPRLRGYLTGVDDDTARMRIKLRHTVIYLAWSGSPTSLANKPCRYVIFDETDKYPATAGKKEADPVSLGEKRANTYRASRKAKIWKLSTPTVESGPIWQAYTTEAQVRFHRHARCPLCGHLHLMAFKHVKFPEGERDPERIEAEHLAWYECPKCGRHWDDELRNQAVRDGVTMSEGDRSLTVEAYLNAFKPKKIAFHVPSWLSPFVSLSSIAAAFLRGTKDKAKLKDFKNAHEALPWVAYSEIRDEDAILALMDDRPRGKVPGGGVVACLVAGVDTQDDGFWYEIRAFGWGVDGGSWQVREGKTETFEILARILFEDAYTDADGKDYLIHLAVQDAMGHRTAEVYDFCRMHRGRVVPSQGVQRLNQPYVLANLEYYPGTDKRIPGGLRLCRVNTTYYKNTLAGKLEIHPDDPGSWRYHAETTPAWARMMVAEAQNDQGLWEPRSGYENHGWDCAALTLVAADILGIRFWPKNDTAASTQGVPAQATETRPDAGRSDRRRLPKWFNNRGDRRR